MNINYTSFEKASMLSFTSVNSDHIKAMENGLKNLGLTIQEEQNLLEEYAIDGRSPEKIDEIKIRLRKLFETKNFLVSKIREAKQKTAQTTDNAQKYIKPPLVQNAAVFCCAQKNCKNSANSTPKIKQPLSQDKLYLSKQQKSENILLPKKVALPKNNTNNSSLNYSQLYSLLYTDKK